MPDLTTRWMGLTLRNPVVAGACSYTATVKGIRELADQGAAAVVLKSVFEEQIRADTQADERSLEAETGIHSEVYEYLRAGLPMRLGPQAYLERIGAIKAAVDIPVIASLNCVSPDQWTAYARQLAAAGADAIELNIYDIADRAGDESATVEARHVALAADVRREAGGIPVAVKLAPYYTALADLVRRLDAVPVQGFVLFNRFLQPDIDTQRLKLENAVNLSRPEDIRLPLRWTAILSGRVQADIALSGGVHDAEGVVKALLAGAAVAQVCSALYLNGTACVRAMITGLDDWMKARGFDSLAAFQGRLRQAPGDDGGFERAQYVRALVGLE